MNVAVSMWSLVSYAQAGRIDTLGFVRYAAELGVQGVELLDVFWQDQERELSQVRTELQRVGIEVSAYAIGNDLVEPDTAERGRQVQSIRDGVDVARELGTSRLRVFSGNEKPDVQTEDGHRWIIDGLGKGAAYAAERGVTLVLENHGLFAGRADQVRRVIEEVGSPALRANLDTGNFLLVNQDPVAAVRELAPWAAYVHLKDFRKVRDGEQVQESYAGLDGSRYVGTVIGAGEVDLRGVLGALRETGYDGWLSIEYEGTGDAKEELAESVNTTRLLVYQLSTRSHYHAGWP